MVGANVYLTPPGTQVRHYCNSRKDSRQSSKIIYGIYVRIYFLLVQGFAPHYDDVEVFILQLEGRKRWRLYEPRNKQEELPRFSSPNFSPSEIGSPCQDVVLEAGDLLYFPRGTIHQGHCFEDVHSMHITISCHQTNTYGDLLHHLLPRALATAMEEDVDFRRGLPVDYLSYTGEARRPETPLSSPGSSSGPAGLGPEAERARRREKFLEEVQRLAARVFDYGDVDRGNLGD